jgi:hypothetical protein
MTEFYRIERWEFDVGEIIHAKRAMVSNSLANRFILEKRVIHGIFVTSKNSITNWIDTLLATIEIYYIYRVEMVDPTCACTRCDVNDDLTQWWIEGDIRVIEDISEEIARQRGDTRPNFPYKDSYDRVV